MLYPQLIPNAPDGSRFLPKLILLSLVRRWSIDVAGVVMSDKWGEVCRLVFYFGFIPVLLNYFLWP